VASDPAAPLVLLHGLLGNADDWRPVIQALPGILSSRPCPASSAWPWICRATAATRG